MKGRKAIFRAAAALIVLLLLFALPFIPAGADTEAGGQGEELLGSVEDLLGSLDTEELEKYLKEPGVYELIQKYGYTDMCLDRVLEHLTDRIRQFARRGMGFPHEIGVFLGYPLNDVKGFIENAGKKYLMIGYWKVYSDPAGARMVFKKYDRAKDCAVNEFLTGKSIREIAL